MNSYTTMRLYMYFIYMIEESEMKYERKIGIGPSKRMRINTPFIQYNAL